MQNEMMKKIFILMFSFYILAGCTVKDSVYNTYAQWTSGKGETDVINRVVDAELSKTCKINCVTQVEILGEFKFNKVCNSGKCVRDEKSIYLKKIELETLKKKDLEKLKQLNVVKENLISLQFDTDKNCRKVNDDLTNMQVIEFSTRIASLMDGDLHYFPKDSVTYINSAIAEIHIYAGIKKALYPKLTKDGFSNLNCILHKHLTTCLPFAENTIEKNLTRIRLIDIQLNFLP